MWRTSFLVMLVLTASTAGAGVFGGTAICSPSGDCEPAAFLSDPGSPIPPFTVTHPAGYDGSGGVLEYRICLGQGSEALKIPLQKAIATWNALQPTIGNCNGCQVWEDDDEQAISAHAETAILHELGHCPLGLDHPERNWDAADDGVWEDTSYTRSWDVAAPPGGIMVGMDFVRGSRDDIQQAGGGMIPESVHWFRIADNNPFTIDSTVIDSSTYSRSTVNDLPAGDSWAVNANRVVGEERYDIQNTQAVMYGRQSEAERKTTLTADDVAMIQMGQTGMDRIAGTADDYTILLSLVDPCEDPVDVIVLFGAAGDGVFGFCQVAYDFSFPQNPFLAFHTTVNSLDPSLPFLLTLNDDLIWDVGDEVFFSGFETGDTSDWDTVTTLLDP